MPPVSICLQVEFSLPSDSSELEKRYQSSLKGILSALYANPNLSVALSFSGPHLAWLNTKHQEALRLISELISRHQIELLGGGYYSPLFPLLLPVDRSGQIEKLTSLIAGTTGKRPRGMNIPGSVWDPSLVTTLQCCNMEYVHLDQSLIPSGRVKFLPVITGEQGKTIKILPLYREFLPSPELEEDIWKQNILQAVKKEFARKSDYSSSDALVTIPFSDSEFFAFLKSPSFKTVLQEDSGLQFIIPQKYIKSAQSFVVSYIPAGMDSSIANYAVEPYRLTKTKGGFPPTIHDFLHVYPQNRRLYERMMHVSLLISQYHGDKMRRQAAREKLWQAQSLWSYVSLPGGTPAVASKRQEAYTALNQANDILQEENARESLTKFDYNADGLNEYVCSMEKFTAVISPKAGAITELDVKKGGGNYAANLSRISDFDSVSDEYQRGIFVEHLFESSEKQSYLSLKPAGNGIFSQVQFTEKKFEAKRHEVQMEGRGEFSSMKLPVNLRKNYIVSSSGISVQYILKNESPLPLKAFFVVETNFAGMDFSQNADREYEAELIHSGKRETVPLTKPTNFESGIQTLVLTNTPNKTSFVFEPNEDAGFALLPLTFSRPCAEDGTLFASRSYCISFFWEVDLAAGMEMEKTVSISFVTAKKRSKK